MAPPASGPAARRGWAAALWIGLVVALEATGTTGAVCARLTARGIAAGGAGPPVFLEPNLFWVGGERYVVNVWCTPSIFGVASALFLLAVAWPPLVFLGRCAILYLSTGLLLSLNTVVSVYVHQAGIPWIWAHNPGLVLSYVATGGLAVYWALDAPKCFSTLVPLQ